MSAIKPSRALIAFALLSLAVAARADDAAIQAAATREMGNPALARGWSGVLIKSLDNFRVVYSQNPDRLFAPASNMKLLTTATAVDVLPADFHYTTPVLRDGSLDGGVLRGNLYLKGSGDATLVSDDLRRLAKEVRAAGITRVEGDIVGDGSVFDNRRLGYGWEWDDLPYYYAAEIDGLMVDQGSAHIVLTPGAVGEAPKVAIDPDAGYVLVRNSATTVPDSQAETLSVGRLMGTNIVTVSGAIRRGNKTAAEDVTVSEPAVYTAYLFRAFLREAGVSVTGAARGGLAPAGLTTVAEHQSGNLAAILERILKPSNNTIAESLLKTLGLVKKQQGSASAGADVVREFLTRIGVPEDAAVIKDGSGLSRQDAVTPDALGRVLAYMWTHPNRDAFLNSLPVAGTDGTLRNRMKGTAAMNDVRAKTGHLSGVSSLSGYATGRDGETYTFVVMLNEFAGPTSVADGIQDRIAEAIAESTK